MRPSPRQPRSLGLRLGAWTAVTLAAVVRLSTPSAHFRSGRFVPADADAAYHLRRARSVFDNPPWPSVHDPFLGFPDGALVPWAPGWDMFLALMGWIVGAGDPTGLAFGVGVALAPLLVGVATVALALTVTTRLWGPVPGLVAGFFVALVPQHVNATQFARPDHNAPEGLFLLALAAEATRDQPRHWLVALLISGACLAWVGGMMYAGLGMGALCLGGLLLKEGARWRRAGGWGMVGGVALLTPPAVAYGLAGGEPFTYAYLSAFQPVFLLVLVLGAAWLLALRTWPDRRRWLGALGLGALLAVGAALSPFIVEGVNEWLLTEDPWLDTVAEMHAMLKGPPWDPAAWENVFPMLGWFYPVFLPALGWVAWSSWREGRSDRLPLLAVALGAALLSFVQNRFGWTLAPLMGVVLGGLVASSPLRRGGVLATAAALSLPLLLNLHEEPVLRAAWQLPKTQQNRTPWNFESYDWIRENTPPVSATTPEYGVGGQWWHGHWLPVLAERPEHIGHFGSYTNGVERYLETRDMYQGSEAELLALMDRDRLRYLVVEAGTLAQVDGPLQTLRQGGGAFDGFPAVTGLRAVFATTKSHPMYVGGGPASWVYERVQPASVQGVAAPGAQVELRQQLRMGEKWTALWSVLTTADSEGRWQVETPYASESLNGVWAGPAVVLVNGVAVERLRVVQDVAPAAGRTALSVELRTPLVE